jgi:hypothetical protein
MSKTEDHAIYEMIAAFTVGCMDKANFMQFKDYLTEGGELPKGELGELQNIISMVPIILELENPDHSIKDKVAKKLIGMKEEIKTKIIEDKKRTTRPLAKTTWIDPRAMKQTTAPLPTKLEPKTESTFVKKISTATSAYQFGDDKEFSTTVPEKPQPKIPAQVEKPLAEAAPKRMEQIPKIESQQPLFSSQPPEQPKITQQEKGSSSATGWIAILLTIILFSIIGYYTFTTTESLHKQIDELNSDVTSLKSQLTTSNNFINNYTSLIEFFNFKDIIVYNLVSPAATEKATAQLLLTFTEKEGLIQFKNAKPLQSTECYQAWAISKGQPYSLGFYQPTGSEYLKITAFPFLPKEKIESFKVTVEPNGGTQSPSANVYLTISPSGGILRSRAF